jgi:hypothetical protein
MFLDGVWNDTGSMAKAADVKAEANKAKTKIEADRMKIFP